MNAFRVDALLRAMQDGPTTRRALSRGLPGIALATGLAQLGADNLEARTRRKRRQKKPPVNRLGCRNVGVVCTNAGHALYWEEPSRFATDLVAFCDRLNR